jgi:copper homeostasis protein
MTHPVRVEAAVDTFAAALAAQEDGASRIELCGPLHDGGTTPSAGLIARCCEKLLVSVNVLIRPRAGDFVYSQDEIEIMKRDIAVAQAFGVDCIAVGALTPDGEVDAALMADLIAMATPLRVVFHRAFDQVRDQDDALELLVSLRVNAILTSGGAATAAEGAPKLAQLVERAGDRIRITAGGKITAGSVGNLVARTGVTAVHARAFRGVAAAVADITPPPQLKTRA